MFFEIASGASVLLGAGMLAVLYQYGSANVKERIGIALVRSARKQRARQLAIAASQSKMLAEVTQ